VLGVSLMNCKSVWVDADEWYPVYTLSETQSSFSAPYSVTEEEWTDYNDAYERFDKWQKRLWNFGRASSPRTR
jgi:hypothetical protein